MDRTARGGARGAIQKFVEKIRILDRRGPRPRRFQRSRRRGGRGRTPRFSGRTIGRRGVLRGAVPSET